MPNIYGPSWPKRIDRRAEIGKYEPRDEPPFFSDGKTLQAVIDDYSFRFNVEIKPYDGVIDAVPLSPCEAPKYFYYKVRNTSHEILVDIHIYRNNEEICPKQNLSFPVFSTDTIIFGELIC
jgi:hypothetical protein